MFEVNVNGRTQRYRSKPTMNVDTTGSSGDVSIPKPLTYDYMPEGYPKNDGWIIEWDGNTEGKTYIEKAGLYKISDMVLTDDDLLSATYEYLDYPGETFNIPADGPGGPIQLSDSVTMVNSDFRFITVRKDNADVPGMTIPEKGVYVFADSKRFKMVKEYITPMSTDFLPKNLNVVFKAETGTIPTICNVTYDELRGWVENDIPVLAVYRNIEGNYITNITIINPDSDSLNFYTDYDSYDGSYNGFTYNSDGTFSELQPS